MVVEGVTGADAPSGDVSESDFRAMADLLDGTALIGTGLIARLWSSPSVSAIGIDTPTVEGSSNVLLPSARAKLSMRIVPGADPGAEPTPSHVTWTRTPRGATVEVERVLVYVSVPIRRPGVRRGTDRAGGGVRRPPVEAGSGGSIPLLDSLRARAPGVHPVGRRGHGALLLRELGSGMTLAATGPILG